MTSSLDATAWMEAWAELIGVATAFRRSCLLFGAMELGVFETIGESVADVATVAARLRLDPQSTHTLLNSLAGIGLLAHQDEGFALFPRHRAFLLAGADSALPDLARYRAENLAWLDAADILRGVAQPPAAYSRELLDGRIAEFPALGRFNELHAAATFDTFCDILTPPRDVLDLGGGDGVFAAQMLARYPDARITVLELPGAAQACLTRHADAIEAGRLVVRYDDARALTPEGSYDLVVINELLELFGDDDKARVVAGAMRALRPVGSILLVKFTLDASGTMPAAAAVFSMRMRLKFASRLETDAEVLRLLRATGCAEPLVRRVGPLKTAFLARRAQASPMCE